MAHVEFPVTLRPLLVRIAAMADESGADVFVVGGTVRDALAGRESRDVDIAVRGDAFAFARRLAAEFDSPFVPLDDENGVARVVLPSNAGANYIDVAQLQGSLEEDLRRRDFTIDALAAPLRGGDVIDVTDGVDDLAAGIVRMTAPRALDDDPLRMLRAVRLAGELGFIIERETVAAIRDRAPLMSEVSGERVRDELARVFALEHAYGSLRMLDDLALLDVILPELAAGRGVSQPADWHVYDVFEHNVHAVEMMDRMLARTEGDWLRDEVWRAFASSADALRDYLDGEMSEGRSRSAILKFAALLHDVAKPQTRSVDADGRIRFLGHADEGGVVAARIMRRLRFSANEVHFVRVLVEEHLRPVQLAAVGEAPTRRALYRFYRALGDAMPAVLLLSLADGAASRGAELTRDGWARQAAYMDGLLVRSRVEEGIIDPPRLLDGHDIMSALGLPEGPRIGSLLEALREAQAAGEVHDQEGALAFVRARATEGLEDGGP